MQRIIRFCHPRSFSPASSRNLDCSELKSIAWNGADQPLLIGTGMKFTPFSPSAAMPGRFHFPQTTNRLPPNEFLYKRALVLAPGRFDNACSIHSNLIDDTLAELPEDVLDESKGGLGLFCLSVVGSGSPVGEASVKESLRHVMMLQKLGYGVMLFRSQELYTMSAFANRYTKLRIHFAIGLTVLLRTLQDSYQELEGALLEGIARLFRENVRLCVYPMPVEELRARLTADQL